MTRRGPARHGRRAARRPAAILSLLSALALLALAVLPVTAARAGRAKAGGVAIRVLSVTPASPARSATTRPLVVALGVTNTSGTALPGLRIAGVRGDPVTSQATLDDVLADRSPQPSGLDIATAQPVTTDLPADGIEHTVVFRSTYGVPSDAGVCQCADGVYPLYFSAERTTAAGAVKRLATAVTFLPSFLSTPQPVRVAWVWPLLDRPHRLASGTVFVDDALATEVSAGGRLDRSLQTVEDVADSIPVTLVVDPELLDELEVMAGSRYTVQAGAGVPAVAGTGRDAALAWLDRFTQLLDTHPGLGVKLTPYADPDVTSLSLNGLTWQTRLPAAMATRVERALGGRTPDYSLTWPASGAYTGTALDRVVTAGATATLLPSTAVSPRDGADTGVASGVARITRSPGRVSVGLLSSAAQADVAATVSNSGATTSRLSQLLAEIAVRAVAQPGSTHTLVLTPPRYVDPDPVLAARTIRASSDSPFARHISLTDALAPDRLPAAASKLAAVPSSVATLPAHLISPASAVSSELPAITSMLGGPGSSAAGRALAASFPVGLQRATSSYWLTHPDTGAQFAQTLQDQAQTLVGGTNVFIVSPSSGSYTLASGNAPLPVTVRNTLPYPVRIRVQVRTANGLPGFAISRNVGVQSVDADSRRTLQLRTTVARSGRIQIQAQLFAPLRQDHTIGESVSLTVHSTAFGVVGVVITVVAGAVLALALLVRLVRRLLSRRRTGPPARPTRRRAPEPAA